MSYGSMIVMVGKRTLNYDEVRKTGTTALQIKRQLSHITNTRIQETLLHHTMLSTRTQLTFLRLVSCKDVRNNISSQYKETNHKNQSIR